MRSPIGSGKGGYGDEIRRPTDYLPTKPALTFVGSP
jgi:hypothetical protein